MRNLKKRLFNLVLVSSVALFFTLIYLHYRDANKHNSLAISDNQLIDFVYSYFANYPAISSLLIASLGFFLISHLLFVLFDKNVFLISGYKSEIKDLEDKSYANTQQFKVVEQGAENIVSTSLPILNAVVTSELSRLEEEIDRLKDNAVSIAQTNVVINSLMVRIDGIILDTKANISNFHTDLPASKILLKELTQLAHHGRLLAIDIASIIDALLLNTQQKTDQVKLTLNGSFLPSMPEKDLQMRDYFNEFDKANKLSNELALEQAELAQAIKVKLNDLSDIAKETNIKSQCIVNSMRDISTTQQGESLDFAKHHD